MSPHNTQAAFIVSLSLLAGFVFAFVAISAADPGILCILGVVILDDMESGEVRTRGEEDRELAQEVKLG